ncbi:MAG: hypothetical protein KBC06_01620 [Candidatus Pacebacteria bacterium]|nr:hypothetical protein [Candidatus Paceibacterota bacterium]
MEKIKGWLDSDGGKNVLIIIIVILVSFGSFELGRLSKEDSNAGIKIIPPPILESAISGQGASAISAVTPAKAVQKPARPVDNYFFASNRGSKYYSLGCSGGKTIKQENRVYFATAVEAEKAGYTLSSSCK